MDLSVFLRGAAIGFALAAPVGPISMLVMRRSLGQGVWLGFVSGLGAATADAAFALVTALGLTESITRFGASPALQMAGGAFVVALGIRTLSQRHESGLAEVHGKLRTAPAKSFVRAYLTTLVVTIAHPLTILSFAAIVTSTGLGNHNATGALALALGVLAGSTLWWSILTGGIAFLRRYLPLGVLPWFGRVSGVAFILFGIRTIFG